MRLGLLLPYSAGITHPAGNGYDQPKPAEKGVVQA